MQWRSLGFEALSSRFDCRTDIWNWKAGSNTPWFLQPVMVYIRDTLRLILKYTACQRYVSLTLQSIPNLPTNSESCIVNICSPRVRITVASCLCNYANTTLSVNSGNSVPSISRSARTRYRYPEFSFSSTYWSSRFTYCMFSNQMLWYWAWIYLLL